MNTLQKALGGFASGIRRYGTSALPALLLLASQHLAADVNVVSNALCQVYGILSNRGLLFGIVLVIVAWAGYQIYMGKREATDTIVRSVIATAIVVGASQLAQYLISGQQCPTP